MVPDQAIPLTLGAIISGGWARRLGGGDKVLHKVGGRPVLDWLADRLAPQVRRLVLNANGDPRRFQPFGLPVVADTLSDRPGPLAGVLAVLDWIAVSDPIVKWVVTVPGDAPFLPHDLVFRLHNGRHLDNATIACAASDGQIHPVAALWPVSLRDALRRAMLEDRLRRVDTFRLRFPCSVVHWPTEPVDPFFNINTPKNLQEADNIATVHPDL